MIFTTESRWLSLVGWLSWLMPYPLSIYTLIGPELGYIAWMAWNFSLKMHINANESFCSQDRCSAVLGIIKTEICQGRKNSDIAAGVPLNALVELNEKQGGAFAPT